MSVITFVSGVRPAGFAWGLVVAVALVFAAGCGGQDEAAQAPSGDAAAAQAVQADAAPGGTVTFSGSGDDGDVTVTFSQDGGKLSVATDKGGLFEAAATALPQDFPANFPMIERGVVNVMRSVDGDSTSFAVTFKTARSVSDAGAWYEKSLPEAGYEIMSNMTAGGQKMLGFQSGAKTSGAVIIAPDGSETTITISLAVDQ